MSDSVRPHRQQPTRLLCPWDSPGKNSGVGCHFLLQCVKVKLLSHVGLFTTPWTAAYQVPLSVGFSRRPWDFPGVLEWVAIAFSGIRGCGGINSSQPFPLAQGEGRGEEGFLFLDKEQIIIACSCIALKSSKSDVIQETASKLMA